jgi:uncharacterized protein
MQEPKNPFHTGELALQEKFGVKDQVAKYGPRMIRPSMPDQHRDFFESLPYFFIGSMDDNGLPLASVVWGEPGFISAPSAIELQIKTPSGAQTPLSETLKPGQEVGLLGLQLNSRRRNRVNGRVKAVSETGFSVSVTQSFGNCPKYIQSRGIVAVETEPTVSPTPLWRNSLNARDSDLIVQADTFFIASASGSLGSSDHHGVDISHRGGTPGFVKILEGSALLFPDFSGNNFYNTLGNIHANPLAGLLFVDFISGDLLHLAGAAEIIWPEDTPFSYEGALRYVKIIPQKISRHQAALPYRWSDPEPSPYLPKATGWTA